MNDSINQAHLTDTQFSQLGLHEDLQKGINDAGFSYCTPIQAQTLPLTLEKQDIAGQAQTGTGKTIAFLLGACHHLLTQAPIILGKPRTLILAPTRELAIQIYKDAEIITKHTKIKMALLYGGTEYEKQIEAISDDCDIIIGTPGRIIDLFKQKRLPLDAIEVFVLDEADRMFDLGFIKDIRYLAQQIPPANQRLNLLFSATLSYRVLELAYEHMNSPTEIKIESEQVVADKIEEYGFYPAQEEKPILLVNLLKNENTEKVVVFVNTKYIAEFLSRTLQANKIKHAVLSGDVPQKKRERLLEEFTHKDCDVLVATDVAARGIHVENVSHVINYDLPQDADDYIHRIGRTARAGNSGVAISFVCDKYAYSIIDIETEIGHRIEQRPITEQLLSSIETAPAPRERNKPSNKKGAKTSRPGAQKPHEKIEFIANYMQELQARYKDDKEVAIPESRFGRFGEVPIIG